MRKLLVVAILLLAAVNVFGHAGEVHKYMGTVSAVQGDGFTLSKTDGATVQVTLSDATLYQQADGAAATRAELASGRRVVVTLSK
ncbi:MAG TPA: hypothetical protein VND45_14630, partial [Thermoanaerobaculia bacterium]|nr:hypothetical protein [Thermoanaerobaculia bacterium]